jgi:hypothetical protein
MITRRSDSEQRTPATRECLRTLGNVSGSINGVGLRFQPFRINDLEMVDQTGASWNRIVIWLRRVEALRQAA